MSAHNNLEDIEALFKLCRNGGTADKLKVLLSKPGNENLLLSTEHQGWTPLMTALFRENIDIVKEILNNTSASLQSNRAKYTLETVSYSGLTLMEIARGIKNKELAELITGEIARQQRLNDMPIKIGFHETSMKTFELIYNDAMKNRYAMIGGTGGYFGGGIYFAVSQQESTKKAMHHGAGFQCELKMGKCFKINTTDVLDTFRRMYCNGNSYVIPTDVMRERLLRDGYDSVWGHQDPTIENTSKRILMTGDEYVVYSGDQVKISHYYIVELETPTFNDNNYPFYYSHSPQNATLWIDYIKQPIIPPKNSQATYYKMFDDSQKIRVAVPLPINEVLQKFPNLQSGDIVDFSIENEPVNKRFYKKCFYIEYTTHKKWIPLLFNDITREINAYIVNPYIKNKLNIYLLEHFKEMTFLKTRQDILNHYQSIFTSNDYLQDYCMKNYINFDEIYPELKTNKYFYHNNFLQNSIIVKNKDSNIKIISNRDIYNISITDLYEHDLEAFNQNINLLIDFVSQKLNISAPYFFPLEINCEIMLRFNKKLYTFKKYFDIENFITTFPSAEIDKIYNPIDNYENENNSKLFIKSICRIDYDKFKTQFNKTDGYNYDITTLPLYKIQPPLNLIPKQHTNLVIKPIENDTTNISFKLILKIFDKENYVEMVNLSDMLYEKDRYYHLLKFINKESIKINDVNNKKELPIIITFDKPTDIEKIEIVELYIKKYLSEYPLKLPIII